MSNASGTTPPTHAPAAQAKDAGQDRSIEKRLQRNPESEEAQLDRGLDESMDASDPPASVQPGHGHEPAASSGYDEKAEKARQHNA
jgi:hypothetical protein